MRNIDYYNKLPTMELDVSLRPLSLTYKWVLAKAFLKERGLDMEFNRWSVNKTKEATMACKGTGKK